jgi:hypothetical protein
MQLFLPKKCLNVPKTMATAGCCGAARATRVSWCGWFLVLWVDPSDQSKIHLNETHDERVVVAACLSLSLPWSPKRNKNSIFFFIFFFKFTARNYSAQFLSLSVCVVAVYLSLLSKRLVTVSGLSTDHAPDGITPSKHPTREQFPHTFTPQILWTFRFSCSLGSVGSLVFIFLLYFLLLI